MTFLRPWLLALAVVLPLLVLSGLVLLARRRRRVAEALGDTAVIQRLAGTDFRAFPRRRAALLLSAAALLGIAAADPRWGREPAAGGGGGLEIVLALDASNSMLAEDVAPSRLERERDAARRIVRALQDARIGVVAFAGRGYVLTPLTGDPGALELYLESLSPEIVTQGGSSLAGAIDQAAALLLGGDSTAARRAVVLMSDGEALEGREEILGAARRAGREGVAVHTVGIGTPGGARIPDLDPETGQRRGFKTEPTGEVAISRLDEGLLREVARTTGGTYHPLARPGALSALLAALRTGGGGGQRAGAAGFTEGTGVRYGWFLAAALLLIALDTLLETRGQRRRGELPRVAALTAALLLAACGPTPDEHYRAGDYARAAEGYRERLERGDTTPRVRYNLGTAILRLERFPAARGPLEAAAEAGDSAVKQRGSYNAGNTDLEPVFRKEVPDSTRRPALERAIERYRRALLLDPGDQDAKWNLELALRLLDREPQSSGGGGGEGGEGGGGGEEEAESDPSDAGERGNEADTPTESEAERVLQKAAQAERDLQKQKLKKVPGQQRNARDW